MESLYRGNQLETQWKGGVTMSKLQKALFLSDKGYKDLKKAICACTLTNLTMLLPFCVTVMIFSEILTPVANGGNVQWNHIWLLWGVGIISALLVFLAAKNDYRKTYIASYQESNATRLRIADHLRKLPMSFFNTKDLSELTTNMMSDCSSMESLLSSTIPPLIANGITVSMILQAGIGITIFVGALLLTSGEIELLPLLMFLLMVTRIYGPILSILANLSSLLNLNVVTNRMRTLLTTPAMEGKEKEVSNCDIELSHVTFAYNQENVIKDISCKIPQGSVTALVGPSGSGKSTISKLIARFWDIQKGKITIGGKDIKAMEPESLMSYMSFVFQDVTLFNDTVMNNIRIGNPNATDEQVITAAQAAYCDEFVREMPEGYQTLLGENGSTLSGGERQRISIARALLKNAPIILLDEATASLDPENEVLVQKAIAKLIEGKTVIMIAHRLRTVVDADQIFVLENGKLVESGTHNELMKKQGLYQKLYHIQQESLGWVV